MGDYAPTVTEAYIDGIWYTISRNRMTYNAENLGTDPATAQAIYIIFACYSRIMQHFKMDTLGTGLVSGQESVVRGQVSEQRLLPQVKSGAERGARRMAKGETKTAVRQSRAKARRYARSGRERRLAAK